MRSVLLVCIRLALVIASRLTLHWIPSHLHAAWRRTSHRVALGWRLAHWITFSWIATWSLRVRVHWNATTRLTVECISWRTHFISRNFSTRHWRWSNLLDLHSLFNDALFLDLMFGTITDMMGASFPVDAAETGDHGTDEEKDDESYNQASAAFFLWIS